MAAGRQLHDILNRPLEGGPSGAERRGNCGSRAGAGFSRGKDTAIYHSLRSQDVSRLLLLLYDVVVLEEIVRPMITLVEEVAGRARWPSLANGSVGHTSSHCLVTTLDPSAVAVLGGGILFVVIHSCWVEGKLNMMKSKDDREH